eukprot:TRINITY_DN4008_c0_g1_i6.p1 TRINITY_DN4008_c0_g1~~TRINITY_DN4008_c0_g1_i6.p1  ORF type:complete len:143 (+),score=12.88 TRINITY_DN4008_c0_g1_i6:92-520(+)
MFCYAGYKEGSSSFYGISLKIICSLLVAFFVFLIIGLLIYLVAESSEIFTITSLLDGQKMGAVRKKPAGRCKNYRNFHIALSRTIDKNQLMALVSLIFMDYYKGYCLFAYCDSRFLISSQSSLDLLYFSKGCLLYTSPSPRD